MNDHSQIDISSTFSSLFQEHFTWPQVAQMTIARGGTRPFSVLGKADYIADDIDGLTNVRILLDIFQPLFLRILL